MPKVTRSLEALGDRYAFDFTRCHYKKGWAQIDTRQDASYYGNWINPIAMKLVSYCEGDITVTECDDETEFVSTVRECVAWHKERGYFIGIDGMCSEPIISAFERLGLGEFLH